MNLRDLHYLSTVAQTLNFKRAADVCHVSQPTLSMQIKKMEDDLGVALFERTNKKVFITETGRRIVEVANRILMDEKQITDIARAVRDPLAGEFKLGAIPTLASYIFPRYVQTIATKLPMLHLLLVEEKTEALLKELKSGHIDAVVVALPVDDPALHSYPLFDDPFLLAVGAKHPLAKKRNVRLADLAGYKLLLLDEGHCLRDQALAVCQTHSAHEEARFRATSLETLRLMIQSANSDLMTLMPSVAASANDMIRYISFRDASPFRTIGLIWRKTSGRDSMIRELAKALAAT